MSRDNQTPLLEIRDLHVGFRGEKKQILPAVDGASLVIYPGQTVAIVGESGSGKSTLAHAIIGLLPGAGVITGGEILFDGHDITTADKRESQSLRGSSIGLVPQDPMSNLNPLWRVGAQIKESLVANDIAHGKEADERVAELLAEAGLPDSARRANQYPHEFSGGMRQRALIAMGLAARPQLLIADEPTSALDVTVQKQILDHLDELTDDLGVAVLLITHDLGLAAERADHLVVMYRGKIVESGPALEILQDPQHPYTQRLVAKAPSLASQRLSSQAARAEVREKAVQVAEGTVADEHAGEVTSETLADLSTVVEAGSDTGLALTSTTHASLAKRGLAVLLDALMVAFVPAFVGILVGGLIWAATAKGFQLGFLIGGGATLVYYVFYMWKMSADRGYTPGKRAFGLWIVDQDTLHPIGLSRSIKRAIILWASVAFTAGIGAIVLAVFIRSNGRRQGWHDFAAKSIVLPDTALGNLAVARVDLGDGVDPVDVDVDDVIVVDNLTKVFPLRGEHPWQTNDFIAVDDVSFRLRRGTTTAIVGESGSGKSTVARMVLGLLEPTSGRVLFDGADVAAPESRAQELRLRRKMQPVFQNPYASLDPLYSIYKSIEEPLQTFGVGTRKEREAKVRDLLDKVALPTTVMNRFPAELSGGQRQRVAIARALALDPEVVICDEAVSALDVLVQAQILQLLNDLQAELGLSYLFITHDLAVVRQIADDVVVMQHGKVVEHASVDEVFANPREDYTRTLLDAIPGGAIELGS